MRRVPLPIRLPLLLAFGVPASGQAPVAPEGYQVDLAVERGELRDPVALAFDGRGRLWIADGGATGRVLVFEDREPGGPFERSSVFLEDVAGIGALEVGLDAIWIAAGAQLWLATDRDDDLAPDGELRSVFADAGIEGTLAQLAWGPDGWLYGLEVAGALWRFRPDLERAEPFARGLGAPLGFDFDRVGRAVVAVGGTRAAVHAPSGAILEGLEAEANGRGAAIYLGGAFPLPHAGALLTGAHAEHRVRGAALEDTADGLATAPRDDLLVGDDAGLRPRALRVGPDGCLYVLDAGNGAGGRVWRVSYGPHRAAQVDLPDRRDEELVAHVLARNDWWVRRARIELQGRGPGEKTHTWIRSILRHNTEADRRVRALWLLHATAGFDEAQALVLLKDEQTAVQAWTVRLALDLGEVSPRLGAAFVGLAARARAPLVRLELAAALPRVPDEVAWALASQLVRRPEDGNAPGLSGLVARGLDGRLAEDPGRALGLAVAARLPRFAEHVARRAAGSPENLEPLIQALVLEGDAEKLAAMLRGMEEALRGREELATPPSWPVLRDRLRAHPRADLGPLAEAIDRVFAAPR